jgi:hypothetical protein
MVRMLTCWVLSVFVAASWAAAAEPIKLSDPQQREALEAALRIGDDVHSTEAGSGCTGGIQYDDGTFEDGIRTTSSLAHNFVTRFDLPNNQNHLNAVCVCFSRAGTDTSAFFRVNVYADDGPGGGPGSLLGFVTPSITAPPFLGQQFVRVSFPGLIVPKHVYIGPSWSELLDSDFFLCTDDNGPGGQPTYFGSDLVLPPATLSSGTQYKALGIRAEIEPVADPEPPAGAWMTTAAIPGFQFKARITSGANTIAPRSESDCLAETLCLSGAIPGRSELFARIIGPRPNGFLWVNLVRFTVSRVEVWVQRTSGGKINYYDLPAIPTDSSELTGFVDKQAFQP